MEAGIQLRMHTAHTCKQWIRNGYERKQYPNHTRTNEYWLSYFLNFLFSAEIFSRRVLCVAKVQRRQMFKIHVVFFFVLSLVRHSTLQNMLKNKYSQCTDVNTWMPGYASFLAHCGCGFRNAKKEKSCVHWVQPVRFTIFFHFLFSPNKELPHATYGKRKILERIRKPQRKMWMP